MPLHVPLCGGVFPREHVAMCYRLKPLTVDCDLTLQCRLSMSDKSEYIIKTAEELELNHLTFFFHSAKSMT